MSIIIGLDKNYKDSLTSSGGEIKYKEVIEQE